MRDCGVSAAGRESCGRWGARGGGRWGARGAGECMCGCWCVRGRELESEASAGAGVSVQELVAEIRDYGAFVRELNAEIRDSSHFQVDIIRFPDTKGTELRICGSDHQENTPQSRICKRLQW